MKEHVSLELIKAVIAMREVKSELEIAEMERAANTAYYMHTTAMKMCKPGMVEQEIAKVKYFILSFVRDAVRNKYHQSM